ncbi:MAG: hypothetical protein ACJ74Z_00820 [Bryobacteraceae bacterium]
MYVISVSVLFSLPLFGQRPQNLEPTVKKYVAVDAARIVLENERIIDGTGRRPVEDQNIVLEKRMIASVQIGTDVPSQPGQVALNLKW